LRCAREAVTELGVLLFEVLQVRGDSMCRGTLR
jgi:hypothetical protein